MAHEVRLKANFRDIDAMQHVNHTVYFSWMETARTEYYLQLRQSAEIQDIDFILATASCEFLRGVRFGETVTVRVRPTRLGATSFDLAYDLAVGAEPVARGQTVQVCFDYASGRKKPIPDALRRALERDLRPAS